MMRKSSSDYIYDKIKEDILQGVLDFGDKVIELDYAEKLNISRTPLREALKKLEIEGIIERLPNGRLIVMELTEAKIEEIFSIRMALENILLDSVVDNEVGIERVHQNLILTNYLIEMKNWGEAKRLFGEYNTLLYSASPLDYAVRLLKRIDFTMSALRRKILKEENKIVDAYKDHFKIITLLKEKKLKAAKEANTAHILKAKQDAIKTLKK